MIFTDFLMLFSISDPRHGQLFFCQKIKENLLRQAVFTSMRKKAVTRNKEVEGGDTNLIHTSQNITFFGQILICNFFSKS